jgi:ectoine hydroxylase-related dioxygenase (phytanoyl-CoA dioxygenase family)
MRWMHAPWNLLRSKFFLRSEASPPAQTPSVKTYPVGPCRSDWVSDSSVPDALREGWIRDGFVVMPRIFNESQIKSYSATVSRARSVIDDGTDACGFGDRVGQLHQQYPELLELASDERILTFLNWALGDTAILFGSLNFEKGTQQEAHIDAIFFWPEPSYSMAGVWIALEDIAEDAGPLFYLPGSHKWPFLRSEDVVWKRPDLASRRDQHRNASQPERDALVQELGEAWTRDFLVLKEELEVPNIPLHIKAGDVVVWHSLLAHGGSERLSQTRSRRSVVFHYISRSTQLYTFEQFMLHDAESLRREAPQPLNLISYNQRLDYMRYDHIVSYSNGNQLLHAVSR